MSDTNGSMNAALVKALHRAQKRVTAIGKHSRNDQQRYDYTSSEDMVSICGTALAEEGLVVRRTAYSVGDWSEQSLRTRNGESTYIVAPVSMRFTIAHVDGGVMEDAATFPAVQSGGRPADKAVAAALTASLGFYLRDLLMVSRGRDVYDIEARKEDDDEAPRPQQRQGQPPAQAKRGPSQRAPQQQAAAETIPAWVHKQAARLYPIAMQHGARLADTHDGKSTASGDAYRAVLEAMAQGKDSAFAQAINVLGMDPVGALTAWRHAHPDKGSLAGADEFHFGGSLRKFLAGEALEFVAWVRSEAAAREAA